jgi:hypothetical protein
MKNIYTLSDPDSKIVRYVGASTNPKSRFMQHIKDGERGKTQKQLWILELRRQGKLPILQIVGKEEDEAKARLLEEKTVIENIETIYNIHLPGKGSKSIKHYKKTGKLK